MGDGNDTYTRAAHTHTTEGDAMKKLVEILIAVLLHPVAVVLGLVNLAGRQGMGTGSKVVWAIVVIFLPVIGPLLYVTAGGGNFW